MTAKRKKKVQTPTECVDPRKKKCSTKAKEHAPKVHEEKDLQGNTHLVDDETGHDIPTPHDHYEHIYVLHDGDGEEVLVNEDGARVKLDDAGEPIYDEETGLPKVTRKKIKRAKAKGSGRRVLRVIPITRQLDVFVASQGWGKYSRQVLADGSVIRALGTNEKVVHFLGGKTSASVSPLLKKFGKQELRDFIEAHQLLVKKFVAHRKLDLVVNVAETVTGKKVPVIGFAESHPGISLKSALSLLA